MKQYFGETRTTKCGLIADAPSGPISVKVFRSCGEVESLRSFWAASTGLRNSDIEIFLTMQRSGGNDVRPYVVGLYRGERLDALLIGQIERRHLPFLVGYFTMFRPLVNILRCPYGALRGNDSAENCRILIRSVVECMRTGEADLALLEHVSLDATLFRCAKKEVSFLLRDPFSPVRPHWKRTLPNNVEELQASFSSSERKRFRQIAKKLSSDFPGQVKIEKLGHPNELKRLIEDVEEVVKNSWQYKLGFAGFSGSAALRDLLKTEAEMGYLRAYMLYLSGKPSGFWLGTAYQETFYSDYTGYDSSCAKYSLGTHLLAHILADLSLDGIRAIDFGFSDEEYKHRFGNVMWHEINLHLFPTTFKGFRLALMRGITVVLSNTSRAIVQRTGLMQWVKKAWRRTGIGVKRELAHASDVRNIGGQKSAC
jgi:hypothetical protein